MAKEQVKFYVNEDEKKRLDTLANLRFMSVPAYAKLTALGVKIQQVKEVYVEQFELDESVSPILDNEARKVFGELLERSVNEGFIQYDADFNKRLQTTVKRLLDK